MEPSGTLTLEEYQALPETEPATEYVEGELRQKMVPKRAHSTLQKTMVILLGKWREGEFDALPEASIDFQVEKRIRSLVPDVSVYPVETIQQTPWDANFIQPPLLAVEILSPGQSIPQLLEKTAFYLEAGVPLVWLVDPQERSVTVCRPDRLPEVCRGEDPLKDETLLPGFSVSVREIFEMALL